MVRALLDGRKTQTRRIIKPQPPADVVRHCWYDAPIYGFTAEEAPSNSWHTARLVAVSGDRLWVRETWGSLEADHTAVSGQPGYRKPQQGDRIVYQADPGSAAQWGPSLPSQGSFMWRPSIHMPRWASRMTLTVTDVRVERLQDISEADAKAEGVSDELTDYELYGQSQPYRFGYSSLWNLINGEGAWQANPWVAAYTFAVIQKNIAEVRDVAA